MGTWFDVERGVAQGRIEPQSVTPPDGENTFVLGADGDLEPAELGDGDYTEVKTIADLTDYDLVSATLDTLGVLMSQYQAKAGWANDADTLFHFDFDFGGDPTPNLISGGFDLSKAGDATTEEETYSPDGTYCRGVPVGSITGKMEGANTPQIYSADLDEFTLQWWMNFDSDSHPGSSGINPKVFSLIEGGVGGLEIFLSGVAGPSAHEWYLAMRHVNSATDESRVFNLGPGGVGSGLVIDSSPGWKLYSVRFDIANGWPTQAELFENDVKVAVAASAFSVAPAPASGGQALQYAGINLWGEVDRVRLKDKWLSDSEITDAYNECVVAPSPVDHEWRMQILIDGRVYATRVIAADESRRWTDIKAPVRLLSGEHEVAFRLMLTEAP
ncbi:MAG: hypothetical protein PVJ28_08045 [Acidimicrobiia bacterium]|jgi:hypothetical protein